MQKLVYRTYLNQVTTLPIHQLGELPKSKSTQPRHMATMVTMYVDIQGLLVMLMRRHFLLLFILGVPPRSNDTVGSGLLSTSFQINPHILPTKNLVRGFGQQDLNRQPIEEMWGWAICGVLAYNILTGCGEDVDFIPINSPHILCPTKVQ